MIQSNTKVSHPLDCLEALLAPEIPRASVRDTATPLAIEKEQFLPTRVSWANNTGGLWQVRGLQRASLGALVPLLTVDEDGRGGRALP